MSAPTLDQVRQSVARQEDEAKKHLLQRDTLAAQLASQNAELEKAVVDAAAAGRIFEGNAKDKLTKRIAETELAIRQNEVAIRLDASITKGLGERLTVAHEENRLARTADLKRRYTEARLETLRALLRAQRALEAETALSAEGDEFGAGNIGGHPPLHIPSGILLAINDVFSEFQKGNANYLRPRGVLAEWVNGRCTLRENVLDADVPPAPPAPEVTEEPELVETGPRSPFTGKRLGWGLPEGTVAEPDGPPSAWTLGVKR